MNIVELIWIPIEIDIADFLYHPLVLIDQFDKFLFHFQVDWITVKLVVLVWLIITNIIGFFVINQILITSKYFDAYQIGAVRERLIAMDDSRWAMISTIQLQDPTTNLIISILVGHFGVDRMIIGDVGLGIAKLLTCGGLGIWTIVDWFMIQRATRDKNMEKIQHYLY